MRLIVSVRRHSFWRRTTDSTRAISSEDMVSFELPPSSFEPKGAGSPGSSGLDDLAGAEARRADLDAAHLAVDDGPHALEVRLERAAGLAGDLAADAALFLGLAAADDHLAPDRALVADEASAALGHRLEHGVLPKAISRGRTS